jgi:uncharacterized protein
MNKSSRIYGLDFARALAILGMMFVNYNIVFTEGVAVYAGLSHFISVFEGRAAAIFLILAGIGISLMSKRGYDEKDKAIKINERLILIKRAVFLFILGMSLYVFFGWSADILHYYGIYLVFVCFFLYLNPKSIFISILSILIISTVLQLLLNYSIGWNATYSEYLDFYSINGFIRNLFFNGYHPVFPWFSFILVGLALGRMGFKKIKKITVFSFLFAVTLEIISYGIIWIYKGSELIIYLFDTKPMNPTAFYILAGSGWAVAIIGISIIISNYFIHSKIYRVIVLTGQMALTHYVLHSVFVLGFFFLIDGLRKRNEIFVIILSTMVFVFMLVFSYFWSKVCKRGPLELLMRKIS